MTLINSCKDNYGLGVSSSGPAVKAWLQGLDASMGFDTSGIKALEKAVALDPKFALAHATLARQQFNYGHPQQGRASLEKALGLILDVSRRETSQINIAAAAMHHDPRALELAIAHLAEWPLDIFVFSHIVGPFGLLAFSGRQNWRDMCVALLEQYRHQWPEQDWWFLTTLGFSLAEVGRLDEAEIAAERALQIQPTGNCAHTLSHVHFEREDSAAGLPFIHEWIEQHGKHSDMRHHLVWHAELFELEEGLATPESTLTCYLTELDPNVSDPQPLETFADNASFLWRCALHDMPLAEEYATAMMVYGRQYFPVAGFAFADLHKIEVAALSLDDVEYLQLVKEFEALDDNEAAKLLTDLAQGFRAFAQQNYATAEALLRPVVGAAVRLGGSNPQRRIVEETWFTASAKSGETASASKILRNRLTQRHSIYDEQILAQLESIAP